MTTENNNELKFTEFNAYEERQVINRVTKRLLEESSVRMGDEEFNNLYSFVILQHGRNPGEIKNMSLQKRLSFRENQARKPYALKKRIPELSLLDLDPGQVNQVIKYIDIQHQLNNARDILADISSDTTHLYYHYLDCVPPVHKTTKKLEKFFNKKGNKSLTMVMAYLAE